MEICRYTAARINDALAFERRLREAGADTLIGLIAANEEAPRFCRAMEGAKIRDEGSGSTCKKAFGKRRYGKRLL